MIDVFSYALAKSSSSGGGTNLPTGGTTGQVLAKKSDADGDIRWEDNITNIEDRLVDLTELEFNKLYYDKKTSQGYAQKKYYDENNIDLQGCFVIRTKSSSMGTTENLFIINISNARVEEYSVVLVSPPYTMGVQKRSHKLLSTESIVNTISSESTNEKVPSALAVFQYIDQKFNSIINGNEVAY